jgi:hypothetical protein
MAKQKQKPKYNFQTPIQQMIATNRDSYNSIGSAMRAEYTIPYTKEQALQIIKSGVPEELKELSRTFFYTSGFYRMMVLYFSTILDYATLTIPKVENGQKITSQVTNLYNAAIAYIDNLDPKTLFTNFTIKVLVEGAYYGMLLHNSEGKANIQELPFEYCRSRFKSFDGVDVIEFNLAYFDNIYDKNKKQECLKTYPKEIVRAYWNYKNHNAPQWYLVPAESGIHFCLVEERPFFIDIIPAIIDFGEYRDIEKDKDKQDLQKIIFQEMPHLNDGELVFEPEEVALMHQGIASMFQDRKYTDIITSFGNMKVGDMQTTRSVVTNNLDKISKSIYAEAGVSQEIFSASNSTSLTRSLEKDTALAMYLGQFYTKWLEVVVNNNFKKNNTTFSILLLPISCFNRNEVSKNAFQGIQYGYSILVPYLCLGISQSEVRDLKILENDILKLHKIMKPLESANTQSAAATKEEGRQKAEENGKTLDNKKSIEEKSEKTITNIESEGGSNE